jgi:hypothetical protein
MSYLYFPFQLLDRECCRPLKIFYVHKVKSTCSDFPRSLYFKVAPPLYCRGVEKYFFEKDRNFALFSKGAYFPKKLLFLLEPKKSLFLITFFALLLYTRVMHLSIKQRKITDCFYLSNLFQEKNFQPLLEAVLLF